MGKFQPLPIVGGCYADDARPYSSQDVVNYLPVKAEASGTRSEGKLTCVPGLVPFCGTNQSPIRGAHNCEGRYFVVAGTTLYQISTLGARTVLGTVPGTGRVCFDHNQITGGNEVVVVNGSQGFVYNTKTGVFAQITDQDFPGSAIARYLGQYILGITPNRTGWFHSDLAAATTWLSTDTYEAESSPDLLVDIQVSQGRALIMGERTIEEWVNEPTENAAFQRGSVIERGAASPFANVIMDNTLIWLGDDGIVYRLDGYTPRRISTFPIEQALSRCTLANAFAFAWEDRGHKVYYLTLPDGHTWGYDIASGLWHRRESYRLDRWVANTLTRWNNDWYAGHYDNGVIYRLDWDVMRECCAVHSRTRTLACIHDNENRLAVDAVALTVDVGTEPSAVTHSAPTVTGAMPDGFVGDNVSYQYTTTGGYPGEAINSTATGLPTGLSLSTAALASGTLTAPGTFTPAITAVNECGDPATLADSIVVTDTARLKWWLEYAASGTNTDSAWFSTDALSWSNMQTRAPSVPPTKGLEWTGARMLGLGAATAETTADYLFAGGITSSTSTPTYAGTGGNPFVVVSGVGFTMGQANYSYTTDGGLTWANAATPVAGTSPVMAGIARLDSGRWLCFVAVSGGFGSFYYSDQTVPTTWTLASNASSAGSPTYALFGYGAGAFQVDNAGGVRRTTDGTAWTYTASVHPTAYPSSIVFGARIGSTWVLSTGQHTRVMRSTDNGATWAFVVMPGGDVATTPTAVKAGGGVLAFSTNWYVFASADAGATWTKSTLPLAETSNYPYLAYWG